MDFSDHIVDGGTELGVKALSDELVSGDSSSVFSEASAEAELEERSETLVSVNLVVVVGHGLAFWVIRLKVGSPFGTAASHGID